MKHAHTARRVLACTLALVLSAVLLPAGVSAAGEAFTFYNGLTWQSTQEDMLVAEHARKSDYDTYTVSGYTMYYFEERSVDGEDNEIGYSFYGGQMVVAAIYFGWDRPSDFAARAGKIAKTYGEPTQGDKQAMIDLLMVISMGAVTEATVDEFTGWRLADGTVVYLINIEGDITLFYCNEPVINQMETGAQGSQVSDPSMDAFVFHGGVTWDMSPEEMLAVEGAEADDVYVDTDGGSTVYALSGVMEGFEAVEVVYYYRGSQLFIAGYYYPLAGSAGFSRRQADMAATFGEPDLADAARLVRLCNTVLYGMMDESYITAFSGWALSDGTEMYLTDLEGDIYLLYFNVPEILDK